MTLGLWEAHEAARVHHDEQYAARQDRRDPAPPALRSPYGKPGAKHADARFGGALELGGTDFGRRAVRRRHRMAVVVRYVMSALPPKADIAQCVGNVCFVPKADMR